MHEAGAASKGPLRVTFHSRIFGKKGGINIVSTKPSPNSSVVAFAFSTGHVLIKLKSSI